MKTYLIPGLGADARMYSSIIPHFEDPVVIEWDNSFIGQSMENYARKLADHIDTTAPFQLLGTSLGGILAIELAKIVPCERLILLSTVKLRSEMPAWLRLLKYLPIHRAISGSVVKKFNIYNARLNRSGYPHELAELIIDMTNNTDPRFIEWAIHQVITWNNEQLPVRFIHIHGKEDVLFPVSNIKNYHPVSGGHVLHGQELEQFLINKVV